MVFRYFQCKVVICCILSLALLPSLWFLPLAFLLGSYAHASTVSEIVSYKCLLDSDREKYGSAGGHEWTFSIRTGKTYVFDDFTEKLVAQEETFQDRLMPSGKRLKERVRSALVRDTWKWRHELGVHIIVERTINLKTLDYTQYTQNKYSSSKSKGKCRKVSLPKHPM